MHDVLLMPPETDFSRRGLMVATAAAGIALAAHPVQAQTMIVTDTAGLDAGMVEVKAADRMIPAYRAKPAGKTKAPTVLVVQEIFGVHEHIKDVCRRLAKAGYCAIAPEMFIRQGDVATLKTIDEIRPIVAKVPDAQVMTDLDAAVAFAAADGADTAKLGITGFCWGGRITWLYGAHRGNKLTAGVAWYGRLVGDATPNTPTHPVGVAAKITAPILGLYGSADQGIPVTTVDEMRLALPNGSKSEIHVYEGAPHAFHADYRPSYREAEAKDGWKRLLAWFKTHGMAGLA